MAGTGTDAELDDRSNRLAQWWYANGLRTGDGVAMLDFGRGARQLHNARTPPRRTALVAAVLCGYLLAAADRFGAGLFVAARFAFRDALGSGEV